MEKYYTGIGSRKTPPDICSVMTRIARSLFKERYYLRSGGADRADQAFEAGAFHYKEIYLPWLGFNGSKSQLLPSKDAFTMAEKYHPAWHNCNQSARKMHARNCHQVLGQDLNTPSEFVVCWTRDGKDSGGTGQALRIARAYDISIYNLADSKVLQFYMKDLSL